MRFYKAILCGAVIAAAVCSTADPASATTGSGVDAHYTPNSSDGYSHYNVGNCPGGANPSYSYPCEVWYPNSASKPISGGYPMITFGTGIGATTSQYTDLIIHLVSWGFVVVASDNAGDYTGAQIYDAASWVAKISTQSGNPYQVPFWGEINTNEIGAMGHSEGAAGAVNAEEYSNVNSAAPYRIKTAATIEIGPQNSPGCTTESGPCVSTVSYSTSSHPGTLLLVNGSSDTTVYSPSTQTGAWNVQGEQSNEGYYDGAANTDFSQINKVWLTLKNAQHNDITNCTNGNLCQTSPKLDANYFGYLTAWMMYNLRPGSSSSYAGPAFFKSTGEIYSNEKYQLQGELVPPGVGPQSNITS